MSQTYPLQLTLVNLSCPQTRRHAHPLVRHLRDLRTARRLRLLVSDLHGMPGRLCRRARSDHLPGLPHPLRRRQLGCPGDGRRHTCRHLRSRGARLQDWQLLPISSAWSFTGMFLEQECASRPCSLISPSAVPPGHPARRCACSEHAHLARTLHLHGCLRSVCHSEPVLPSR